MSERYVHRRSFMVGTYHARETPAFHAEKGYS
jgi:hypothetical protein